MNRFLGIENSVENIDDAQTAIIPVPVEYSTSYGTGTANGPESILRASPYLEFYDEELDFEVWKSGIYTAPAVKGKNTSDAWVKVIEQVVSSYLTQSKFLVILGGEHSISYPAHEAFYKKYPDISVLQLDAHSDMRDLYEGSKYSHACVMRRIWERNKSIVSLGIRSQCIEEREFIKENDIRIYYAHELQHGKFPINILDYLGENVYITIDADFFDPSIMPSVGTPEPGGFFWYETLSFLKQLFETKNIVGLDVVELSPIKNLNHPDFFLAKLIYKLIGYKFYRKEK